MTTCKKITLTAAAMVLSAGLAVGGTLASVSYTHLCYVGDALYPATGPQFRRYNAGLLLEQLRKIESCNAKYISLSHRTHFKYSKRAVVRWLKAIYKLRGANEAYIYL